MKKVLLFLCIISFGLLKADNNNSQGLQERLQALTKSLTDLTEQLSGKKIVPIQDSPPPPPPRTDVPRRGPQPVAFDVLQDALLEAKRKYELGQGIDKEEFEGKYLQYKLAALRSKGAHKVDLSIEDFFEKLKKPSAAPIPAPTAPPPPAPKGPQTPKSEPAPKESQPKQPQELLAEIRKGRELKKIQGEAKKAEAITLETLLAEGKITQEQIASWRAMPESDLSLLKRRLVLEGKTDTPEYIAVSALLGQLPEQELEEEWQ